MTGSLPYLIDRLGEVDFSSAVRKNSDILLFKDMAEDIDYISEIIGHVIFGSETFILLPDDKIIFSRKFFDKDEITRFLMKDVFTSRMYMACVSKNFVGINVPSDQYSAFIIENFHINDKIHERVKRRFIEMVKDGSIGFPDASVPYFNNLLSSFGFCIL